MAGYQKMYITVFNAVTQALEELEKQNLGAAKECLLSAQLMAGGDLSAKRRDGGDVRPRPALSALPIGPIEPGGYTAGLHFFKMLVSASPRPAA